MTSKIIFDLTEPLLEVMIWIPRQKNLTIQINLRVYPKKNYVIK